MAAHRPVVLGTRQQAGPEGAGGRPAVVVGHSQGEIAAAHVAGALTLPDAARVAALRSAALVQLAGAGAMLSVFLPAGEVLERIERFGGGVSLASYNSPRSTVVSGEPQALRELLEECEAAGERARMIAVDYASHSQQIETIRERLLEDLRPVAPVSARIPIFSTTTAALVDGAALDAEHWYRNLREPVRFEQATRALAQDGVTAFVECSPHPVLTWAVQETVEQAAPEPDRVAVVGSLRRGEGTLARFLASAGEAFARGVEVDWEVAFAATGARRVGLPTYPFERTRFWLEHPAGAGGGGASLAAAGVGCAEHPLLGAAVELAGRDGCLLTGRVALATHPWLADHELFGEVVLPQAAFAELALRAGAEVGCEIVADLALAAPLVLPAQGALQLQVTAGAADERGRRALEVHARPDRERAPWVLHASGTLSSGAAVDHEPLPQAWPPPGAVALDVEELYDRLAANGRAYGPAFQVVRAWRLGDELFSEVALPEEQAADGARFAVHPALLDAALHPAVALREAAAAPLGLRWTGLRAQQRGALALRVRIAPAAGDDGLRLTASDERGAPVLAADAIALRPLQSEGGARDRALEALYRVRWTALQTTSANGSAPRLAALGAVDAAGAPRFADVDALAASSPAAGTVAVAAPRDAPAALALLQAWLADERLRDVRLAVLVRGAAAVRDGETADPRAAAIRGLLRSAQSEHPGRFVTIDGDAPEAIAPAVATGEAEVAVRDGAILVARLVRAGADPPPSRAWRLAPERAGALVGAAPTHGDGDRPLESGEVRLAIRAAGVNARDVLVAIGVHAAQLGIEGAGVVVEVGPGVGDLSVGDRVMGLVPGAFGPLAVADARLLVPVPPGWSSAQAATVPVAHATAHLALVEVAKLERGERVLIQGAAGGVGMAAVALAQRVGAEVFATASPAKWDALRARGIDDAHLASSRSADFATRFGAVDVVLNCLGGELVDAALGLLARGGRFVELGSADVRDRVAVAVAHPGVAYERVDLFGTDPQRLGELLRAAVAGAQPLPVTAWDVREGSRALEFMSRAAHVGKVVLTVPQALDPAGTVLVTGGTGGLGAVVAEHLAREHAVRHLLLVSRRGPAAPGIEELQARLRALGCEATAAACDVADRGALAELLGAIDPRRPLTAVVHAAGTLDNGMVESFDEARLDGVMRPKATAARWLDELTRGQDLAAFLLFSSVAATFSHPGQGNYAAANAYLDALAQRRRSAGMAASAVAGGLWGTGSGMSTRLSREDIEVLAADTGQRVLPVEQALALLDVALGHREPLLVATTLDRAALRAQARSGVLPALLSDLVRAPPRSGARDTARGAAGDASLARQLEGAASPDERQELVLELVRAQAAAVLGHASSGDVPPDRPFKELGFDSLGSVVLRNRLAQITGLRLPSTLVFDHPTPVAMAAFVRAAAEQEDEVQTAAADEPDRGVAGGVQPSLDLAVLAQRDREVAADSTNGDGSRAALPATVAPVAGYRGTVL
ncbi:MAG: SDR family NAD(P)-dependent oxidoreductase, partial [Actinobacteria bacterium]|nr:SDR family NAD(P)-dependent oxidoreductase [Actinomycetota bacterium]